MLRETKQVNGVEMYQLGITKKWTKAHPVPELEEGLVFYSSSYSSPCFLLRTNQPDHHVKQIIPGMPPEEAGEYWLVFIPSSGSEPLMWLPRDYIEGSFQTGMYRQNPSYRWTNDTGEYDYSNNWWWPILQADLEKHCDDENPGLLRRLLDRLGW